MAIDDDPVPSVSSGEPPRTAVPFGRPPGPAERIDCLLGDLALWAADTRAADAADARSRERWLRRQAAEEATLSGVGLDLAEQDTAVVVRSTSGRAHHGRLVAVARDFWLLVPHATSAAIGSTRLTGATLVATEAIASLRAQPAETAECVREASGARPVPLAVAMAEVLADLATERPLVRAVVRGEPEAIVGELCSVGVDIVTMRVAGVAPITVYVRLGSVTELSVLGSG